MKKIFSFLLALAALLTLSSPAYAVCPVCTIAIGAGLGISRYLGIDDVVTSIWIGGLILSASFWTSDWLNKKYKLKTRFKYLDFVVILAFYALTLGPLAWAKVIGVSLNTLWGVDKILLGTFIGSLAFLFGILTDRKVREVKGHQLFNFQKVLFPVLALAITSLLFYFLTR